MKFLVNEKNQRILLEDFIRKMKIVYENGDLTNTEKSDKNLYYLLLILLEENEDVFPKEKFQTKSNFEKLFISIKSKIIKEIKDYRMNKIINDVER